MGKKYDCYQYTIVCSIYYTNSIVKLLMKTALSMWFLYARTSIREKKTKNEIKLSKSRNYNEFIFPKTFINNNT